jgi:hypothetical protein
MISINWKASEENGRVYWQPVVTRLRSKQMNAGTSQISARTLPIYPRIRFMYNSC